jgi:uncharacterized membrane protein YkvA (DUF1232 family)
MARLKSVFSSDAFRRAQERVADILKNPSKLMGLSARVQQILRTGRLSSLGDVINRLKTAMRLVRRYAQGDYRDISLQSIALIVTSFVYLVMPLDLIPDFMLGLGFSDDAALLIWTLHSVMEDLTRFEKWEAHDSPIDV